MAETKFKIKSNQGFTLVELLLAIVIIAVIAAVVFVALDPAKRFAEARNATRSEEIRSILDAAFLYMIDERKEPEEMGLTTEWQDIGSSASESDWLSGWSKRKPITVTENSGSTLTNYSTKITLAYDSDMQTDFDDIRFTTSDGQTQIDYWLEDKTDSSVADFWIEVPSLAANSSSIIYAYYDNNSVSTASDGHATFYQYIDFNVDGVISYGGSSQDRTPTQTEILDNGRTLHMWGNNWKATDNVMSLNNNYKIDFKFKNAGPTAEINGIGVDNETSGINSSWFYKAYGTQNWGRESTSPTYSGSGEYEEIGIVLNDFTGSFNYLVLCNDKDSGWTADVYYQDVRVRKYTASEPSSSTGAEQEQSVDGLDWNQYLAPNYFEEIPYDPKTGSASVTKYEAKMSANGRISIRAVGAEEDETLEVSR